MSLVLVTACMNLFMQAYRGKDVNRSGQEVPALSSS